MGRLLLFAGRGRIVLQSWEMASLASWHADLAVLDLVYPQEIAGGSPSRGGG